MGCDIHIVVERRTKASERWIGLYATDHLPGGRPPVAHRDYDFFAEVAGVRGASTSGNHPRNLPEDVSELAWKEYMRCPTDHYSVSHMSVGEFAALHNKVNPTISRAEYAVADLLGIFGDEHADHRVVFWFDN